MEIRSTKSSRAYRLLREGLWAIAISLGLACFFAGCRCEQSVEGNGLEAGHYPPNATQEPQPDFARFVESGRHAGTLDTAIATYEGKNGEKVELIGAIHIADTGYYTRLEKTFAGYQSLLYELILSEGDSPPKPEDYEDYEPDLSSGMGLLGALQHGMGSGLGLNHQVMVVDYTKPNFVHADLNTEAFIELSKQRGQTGPQLMAESMAREFLRPLQGKGPSVDPFLQYKLIGAMFSKKRQTRLKYLLAKEVLSKVAVPEDTFDLDGDESVIIIERNKRAIEVLRERLAAGEKHIGVFYGAAHLPDLEQRIFAEIGLKRTGVRWETAWRIE